MSSIHAVRAKMEKCKARKAKMIALIDNALASGIQAQLLSASILLCVQVIDEKMCDEFELTAPVGFHLDSKYVDAMFNLLYNAYMDRDDDRIASLIVELLKSDQGKLFIGSLFSTVCRLIDHNKMVEQIMGDKSLSVKDRAFKTGCVMTLVSADLAVKL